MADLSHSKILVVDDISSNIDILVEILGNKYDLSIATNGEQALRIASDDAPDLILLDIMMPGMDGYEVCRRLKSMENTAQIPIIFVTAKNEIEDEQKGFALGAVDYIKKPFSPPIISARVRNHLLLKRQHDQLEKSISILQHKAEILQQKAVLGLQACGLAHDINNILAVAMIIELVPHLLPDDFSEKETVRKYIASAIRSLLLGQEVCQGYTSYLSDIEVEAKIQQLLPLLQPLDMYLKEFKGSLIREYADDIPPIYCKGYQIKRVVVNLLSNAMQAVESQKEQVVTVKAWSKDWQVFVSVQDNGQGIPADVLPHIFKERFTTKEKGTGLGLFMAKEIVDAHHGIIEVDSKEGKGTTITLSFPAA